MCVCLFLYPWRTYIYTIVGTCLLFVMFIIILLIKTETQQVEKNIYDVTILDLNACISRSGSTFCFYFAK